MKIYEKRKPLVSLHVPKTAGTSLRKTLRTWFPDDRLHLHYRKNTGELPPVHRFEGPICIHGHFNASNALGVDAYYPQAEQFIVFLREPFERFVSTYFHFVNVAKLGVSAAVTASMAKQSFETFLKNTAADHAAGRGNPAYEWFFPGSPDVASIQTDLERRFVFVGISERYGASTRALARALGRRPAEEMFENTSERTDEDLSRWRAEHERHFPAEYELYEAALQINAEHLKAWS